MIKLLHTIHIKMSIALTISGDSSLLNTTFFPALSLKDNYECALLYFSAFNSIPNITLSNNMFYYGDDESTYEIEIPFGAYELDDIAQFLNTKMNNECEIKIVANNNTLKCSLYCEKTIYFNKHRSLASLLGFKSQVLEANKWHDSDSQVDILPLTAIRIECDLVHGSYTNGVVSHIIHEFVPNVPPGYRFIEAPANVIYFPVNKKNISSVTIKVIDIEGNFIDFRGETIQLRLHLRKST